MLAPWVLKLGAVIRGRGRPVGLALILATVFFGGWYVVWCKVRDDVLSSDEYWLTARDVEITPLPEWIHTDIRAQVFRDASLDGPLLILDEKLTERIANAFSLHAWVAKVHRVTKHHPARVKVELSYRRPVCMIQVPGGLLPVDVGGVLLPSSDFSPIEASRFPRLVGVETAPMGPVGTRWGDGRVVGAAEIAAAFGEAWAPLELDRLEVSNASESPHGEQYTYELFTRHGTRILWGRAPGSNIPGAAPAADKVARLRQYAKEHGSLEGRNGPQQLDVRNPQSMRVSRHEDGGETNGLR